MNVLQYRLVITLSVLITLSVVTTVAVNVVGEIDYS